MKKSSIEAVKKQWFTSIILILFAVWIVINPAGGLMRQMILIFLLFFSQDETNVFFNIAWKSTKADGYIFRPYNVYILRGKV